MTNAVLGRAPGCTAAIRNSDTASPFDILVFAIVECGERIKRREFIIVPGTAMSHCRFLFRAEPPRTMLAILSHDSRTIRRAALAATSRATTMNASSKTERLLSFLKGQTFFGGLPDQALETLVRRGHVKKYSKGDTIFHRGDAGDSFMVIVSGPIKIANVSADAKEVVLNFLQPGGINGEIAVLDGNARSADAIALEASEVLVIFGAGSDARADGSSSGHDRDHADPLPATSDSLGHRRGRHACYAGSRRQRAARPGRACKTTCRPDVARLPE
jgi:Cyclic nucleotide-binding domain